MENKIGQSKKRQQNFVKPAVAALVGAALAQSLVMGLLGGIGPLGFLKKKRQAKLPGNGKAYDFSELLPAEHSPLRDKQVFLLGSSVAKGEASEDYALGEYLTARLGCRVMKETVSGTTLADDGPDSYVRRMQTHFLAQPNCDLFLCQLSTNDATRKKPLGEISESRNPEDFDRHTVTGAMEYLIATAREHWHCPVVFFTNARYDSPAYGAMVDRLYQLREKWGIGILDLWRDDRFNDISPKQRRLYMADAIHPTKAGYRDWWCPEQERQLLAFLEK